MSALRIAIVTSTRWCAHCQPAGVDPYWREVAAGRDWHDVARGDGSSYGGVVEWVEALPGESPDDTERRAWDRVAALCTEGYGCRCDAAAEVWL